MFDPIPNAMLIKTNEEGTLTLHLQQPQQFTIQLFDGSGKLYLRESRTGLKGTNTFTIDHLSKYPKGTYLVQITIGSSISIQKLVVK